VGRTLITARRPTALCVVVVFAGLAAIAAWRSFESVWTPVGQQRLSYSKLSAVERDHSAGLGLADLRVFYFWASRVHRGDRYYLNVKPASAPVLSELAGYYLVPAERVIEPKRATVVLSWDRKPSAAGLRLRSSTRFSGVDATFSRVAP
jgi:hypothetical protein